jgi:hypothetical protein
VSDEDEGARLRRQLRAMAAVNEALRAQLEALGAHPGPGTAPAPGPLDPPEPPPPLGAAPRRGRAAVEWSDALALAPGGDAPLLVQHEDGSLYVIEGGRRRPLSSRLLVGPLEDLLGGRRRVTADELAPLDEGAPVEVLEVQGRPPFVVVGGRALTVRGLPLPFPVEPELLDALPSGPALDVAAPLGAKRADQAVGWLASVDADASPGEPELVVSPEGPVQLIDGGRRRDVGAWLVPALEDRFGERRVAGKAELDALATGPPVALLEARRGPPFVVIGGRRLNVRGIPLAHPVDQPGAERLPDGPAIDVSPVAPRRSGAALGWLGPLTAVDPGGRSRLVTVESKGVYVLDGGMARRVRARLLVDALELVLGERQTIAADELDALDEGPPVEVVESASGPPFVVIGGARLVVTGLPLPVPVDPRGAAKLVEGPELDVVEPLRAALRREAERDAAPADPVRELRHYADEKGGMPAALAALTKRGARKITKGGSGDRGD